MGEQIWDRHLKQFIDGLEESGIAVFFSDPQFFDFMQPAFTPYLDRNFYYLTGLTQPGLCLLADKESGEAVLYASDEGAGLPEGSRYRENCRPLQALTQDVASRMDRAGATAWFFTYEDSPLKEKNKYGEMAAKIAERSGPEALKNSYSLLARLRQKKEPWELQEIRTAIRYTKEALDFTAQGLREGIWEYEALADYDYHLAKNQRALSFQMAASGPNALQPHYLESGRRAEQGEMMLFDLGALSHCYTSDISRTYPVGGRFTERQKELYRFVLEAQQLAYEMLRPGIRYRQIDEAVCAYYGDALKAAGLISGREEVGRYCTHGIGHPLGLYVHDPGSMEDLVVEGGVYTLEPGLYIPEEGIGIRVEDDYLVTANGAENLSVDIEKQIVELENMVGSRCRKLG